MSRKSPKKAGFAPKNTSQTAAYAEASPRSALTGGNLTSEFAVRQFWNSLSALSVLPNPDPVLQSEGLQLSTYRRMNDGHLGAVTRKRRAAVRARPWQLNSKGVPARLYKRVAEMLGSLDIRNAMSILWSGNLYGFSVLEVMWEMQGGLLVPVELKDKPQEWFGWHSDGTLRFLDDAGLGEVVPPRKFLVARSEPTFTNPYGKPLLSECFWPLAFKRGGLRFWMTFLERYGMPRAIGKVPASASETERETLLGSMVAMVQDAAAVINDNQSLEIQEATGKAASTSAYSELVRWADTEISKAILGETLTTELPTQGSMAAAQVHNDVRKDLALDDAALIEARMNELIRWICELNFPGETAVPRFEIILPEDLNGARVERDKKLSDMGLRFTPSYFADTYGIDAKYIAGVAAPSAGDGSAAAATTEYAEAHGDNCCEFSEDDLVELFKQVSPEEMQSQIEELVKPILELAKKHADFAEFDKALEELFPKLDFDAFQDAMEKCLLLSEMQGRTDA
jgi:phage gp29-like protein